jgi:hypothetical protein
MPPTLAADSSLGTPHHQSSTNSLIIQPKSVPHRSKDKVPEVSSREDLLIQKRNIATILKELKKENADIRLVCIGESPKYGHQIQSAYEATHWRTQSLYIGSASNNVGAVPMTVPLFGLGENADSPTLRAVADALSYGRVAAPMHVDMHKVGPVSLGVPAGTIAVQKKWAFLCCALDCGSIEQINDFFAIGDVDDIRKREAREIAVRELGFLRHLLLNLI